MNVLEYSENICYYRPGVISKKNIILEFFLSSRPHKSLLKKGSQSLILYINKFMQICRTAKHTHRQF